MKKLVKTISFLFRDERIYLHSNSLGKFKMPVIKTIAGKTKKIEKYFWPREVVEHEMIKGLDPFLTLSDGLKLRVYQGGDSAYMLTEVECILDLHEEQKKRLSKEEQYTLDGLYSSLDHSWYDDMDDIF